MSISTGVGLISGIDFDSLISQLSNASRRPIFTIERKIRTLNTQTEAYGLISQRLTTLRDQLRDNLLSGDSFDFLKATSTDESVLTADVGDSATLGNFSVRVLQLAQTERVASQGVSALDATIAAGAGSVVIEVGTGNIQSYSVDATTTLEDLRDLINNDADSKVTANIINDGSQTNSFRLVLTGKTPGSDNTISFLTNDTSLDFENRVIEAAAADPTNGFDGTVTSSGTYTGTGTKNIVLKMVVGGAVDGVARFVVSTNGGLTFDTTQYAATSAAFAIPGSDGVEVSFGAGTLDFAVGDTFSIDAFDPMIAQATDAVISVDGIQITRSSNTFSDVIDGVTFTAHKVDADAVTVTVENQTGLINGQLAQFQQNFNSVISAIQELSSYDVETHRATALFADSSVRRIRTGLVRVVMDPIPGITGKYKSLSSIGMGFGADGLLSIDLSKISAAVEEDPNAIIRLFGRLGESSVSGIEFLNATDRTEARNFAVNVTTAAERAVITGGTPIQGSGLAGAETLTFTVDDNTFTVNLLAGDKLATVVSKINAAFSSQGVALEALDVGGALQLQSTEYGSDQSFSVQSDVNGAGTQTDIGTVQQSDTGVDVAGTINGSSALGDGQVLHGMSGTASEGLEILVTATAAISGAISFTRGITDRILDRLDGYLDPENGIINVRQEGIARRIASHNERIDRLEVRVQAEADRYRRQFLALERQLAILNSQGMFLTGALAQLASISRQRFGG